MEDLKILEAVERYISGEMSPDERVFFEQLRKTNQEVDQAVVEHTFFLQQMNRFDNTKNFKSVLEDTHIHLAEKGLIKSPKLRGKAKVVYLYNRYKKVAAIAASIAGITALTISALVWSLPNQVKNNDLVHLKGEFNAIKGKVNQIQQQNQRLTEKINDVSGQVALPAVDYKTGGTGFMISNNGLIVTNAHVVEGANNIAVQNNNEKDLNATIVYLDKEKDIAILKITDKSFNQQSTIPFSIKRNQTDIAEPIFTLGFPKNEIVYGEGYLSSKTGYNGDTLSCQITIAANRGNSGSPVFNKNGEVIGILNAKQSTAEGAVFAIRSKYIFDAITALQKDTAFQSLKLPSASALKGNERTRQVEKIKNFVFMVKVN
jgi:S1-C subfamily serine protease